MAYELFVPEFEIALKNTCVAMRTNQICGCGYIKIRFHTVNIES